jgi:hypothetical protein
MRAGFSTRRAAFAVCSVKRVRLKVNAFSNETVDTEVRQRRIERLAYI